MLPQVTDARTEFEQFDALALEERFVVNVPTSTHTPEGSEASVLTKLRRTFVAVNQVEEYLLLPNRVEVGEEATVR